MGFWSWLTGLFRRSGPNDPIDGPDRETDPVAIGAAMTRGSFERVRDRLDVQDAEIWAVLAVETRGYGFLAGRQPAILFERHIFSRETNGAFDESHPDISNSTPGGYSGGVAEYDRVKKAAALNRSAALRSASWGLGQVMGFNAENLEYPNVEDFVARQRQSEDEHLEAFMRFLLVNGLADPLRAHDWREFARRYNGPNYEQNNYHTRLAQAYARFSSDPQPDFEVRTAQLYLTYLSYDPHGIDGLWGPATKRALGDFLRAHGQAVPPDGPDGVTQEVLTLLRVELSKLPVIWPL